MNLEQKSPISLFVSGLSKFIFKILYFIVSYFILIGDITRAIFKYIYIFIASIVKNIRNAFIFVAKTILHFVILLKNIALFPFKKIYIRIKSIKSVQKSYTSFPKERIVIVRPIIQLPKFKFPKITIRLPKLAPAIALFIDRFKFFILGTFITIVIVFGYQSYFFVTDLPSPNTIGKVNYPLSSHIYDRSGKLLYEVYRDQNRTPILLKDLPSFVYQSTIAIEDKDFYKHNGISLVSGIFRAIKDMIVEHNLQGGSTITQQLVKTALLTPERTIQRKIKEIILALWTENLYSKDKILEMYLNQVPYGGSAYGIEEASKVFFGKKAKDLTLEEAALLAGLPQAPSLYSPFINPEYALQRRNDVIKAMFDQGYITESKKNDALISKLDVILPQTSIKAPHFVFYTKSQLESLYGISRVEEGGLKVTSTIDLTIQEQAEQILKDELAKIQNLNVTNGAILVTKPSTGEILAMVGSVDYFAASSGAFNVTTALRQPGSSIKPIMYSLALQKGFTAGTILDDSPVVFNISSSESYKPVNYDGQYHGKVPLRYALANSYNIPAVRVMSSVGVSNFIDYASKLGISTWEDKSRYGLSIALGGGEVTMLDMAEAFGTLANGGYKVPLQYYVKIEDASDGLIKEKSQMKIREMDEGVAFIISDILSDNFARQWAFGPKTTLEIPGYKVAVKTGTTNDKKDNWTIGYTPDFLVAVWVGNNNNQPMNPYLSSGITGAAPIWNRVMSYVLKNNPSKNSWYSQPEDVVAKTCYFGRTEYFIRGTEKNVQCGGTLFGGTPSPTPIKNP
ncbi:MAG: PBP1A family penicillin-binding protein [bacterium]|nr:PBP1A family penicillin-binding protein [bacterium]